MKTEEFPYCVKKIIDPINITKMLSKDDIFDLQKTIENEDNDLLLEHEESLRSAYLEDFDPFDPFEVPFWLKNTPYKSMTLSIFFDITIYKKENNLGTK